jgi:cytoskeletal protein RodZ
MKRKTRGPHLRPWEGTLLNRKMNRTRIEIATNPPELPSPHFDDETTIVSARQVVPLAQTRVVEQSRALLSIVPILLAAAVFGALGALGVNYFEHHQRGNALVSAPRSEISQPANQTPTSPTQSEAPLNSATELPAGALAPLESSSPGSAGAPTQSQTESQTTDPTTGQKTIDSKAGDDKALPPTPAQANSGSSPEPGKLIRKRRVHPQTQGNERKTDNPGKDKRGAGRIQEIFAGPNPP